jgi:hypothetical protein
MRNTASQSEPTMLKAIRNGCDLERVELLKMHPNQDVIFERLETTKQFGLLSDYLVSWSGQAGRLTAKVTVWGKEGMPEEIVRHYVGRLLKGLVTDGQIFVAN